MIGYVCGVWTEKAFGFIRVDGQTKDTFFHRDELDGNLPFDESLVEMRVEFETTEGKKGAGRAACEGGTMIATPHTAAQQAPRSESQ